MINCGDGKLTNGAGTNQLPAMLRINRTVIGTIGVNGMPVKAGIGGHPRPPEVTMKVSPRGHHGRIPLKMGRKSTSGVGREPAREDLA